MLKSSTVILILCFSFCLNSFSQNKPVEIKDFDGNEISICKIIPSGNNLSFFPPLKGKFTTFTFINSGQKTGYDLQSNSTARQIWEDPIRPENVHAVFQASQQASGWSDRAGLYFFSTDYGVTWNNYGSVTNGIRSGFPAIDGKSNGAAVITVHTSGFSGGTARSQIYIDEGPGAGYFEEKDPGNAGDYAPIWGRVQVDAQDRIVLAASISAIEYSDGKSYTSSFNGTAFTPWLEFNYYSTAEVYALAKNASGNKIGMAFIGKHPADDAEDVFYRESSDGGASWTQPLKIWDCYFDGFDNGTGALRGISIIFLDDDPYITWENAEQPDTNNYYPGTASSIMLWSPAIDGGNPKTLVDTSNFEEYSNFGVADVMVPVCRPSIGKSSDSNALFLLFNAASDAAFHAVDTATPYYDLYFMYSTNKGVAWTTPERINPTNPRKDWRYGNISPINHVDPITRICTVQMIAQVDSIPGSTSQTTIIGWPAGITAEAIFITAKVLVPLASPVELSDFSANLFQNKVLLKWNTITEKNNSGFDVERFIDNCWKKIGFVNGNGTTLEVNKYLFIDNLAAGTNNGIAKYRIKQIDFDGSFNYSQELDVSLDFNVNEYSLDQNYPNPFNPETIIKYSIAKEGHVKLTVYNAIGSKVASLVDENKSSGNYAIPFNGSSLASGMYFYRLESGNFSSVKKFILMK